MKLDRVAIAGADDSIDPYDLMILTKEHPWVEWGILASRKRDGEPRYPSAPWIRTLQRLASRYEINGWPKPQLALHLCGSWVRQLMQGQVGIPAWMFEGFDRIQINFGGNVDKCDKAAFRHALDTISKERITGPSARQIIFQIGKTAADNYFSETPSEVTTEAIIMTSYKHNLDAVPLYDVSGGKGMSPTVWHPPFRSTPYQGYAGGLGPQNLVDPLDMIAAKAGVQRVWIDMESGVRSDDNKQFNMNLVEQALLIAKGWAENHAKTLATATL